MFKVEELKNTVWESYKDIPNEIPEEYHNNAERLANLMNRIEKRWRKSLAFTCAFRGEVLNKKMGGVANSSHKKACAVDFVVLLEEQDKFMNMLKDNFGDEIDFAQNYIYRIQNGKKYPRNFVHVNIADGDKVPRQVFNTEIVKGKNIVFGSQGSSVSLFKA